MREGVLYCPCAGRARLQRANHILIISYIIAHTVYILNRSIIYYLTISSFKLLLPPPPHKYPSFVNLFLMKLRPTLRTDISKKKDGISLKLSQDVLRYI